MILRIPGGNIVFKIKRIFQYMILNHKILKILSGIEKSDFLIILI